MRIEHRVVTFIDDDIYTPDMPDQLEKVLAHHMIIDRKQTCFVTLVRIGDPEPEEDDD